MLARIDLNRAVLTSRISRRNTLCVVGPVLVLPNSALLDSNRSSVSLFTGLVLSVIQYLRAAVYDRGNQNAL